MKSTKIFASSNVNGMIGQQKISARFIQFLLFGCLFLCMFSLSNSSNPSSSSSSPTTFYSEQKDNEEQYMAQNGADEQENNKIEDEEEVGANMQKEIVENEDNCDVHHNQGLHALMERICELCHDMYSHQRPNMRADCRSNCFRNDNFKRCLRLFKPIAKPMGQNRGMRHLGEAMDALSLF